MDNINEQVRKMFDGHWKRQKDKGYVLKPQIEHVSYKNVGFKNGIILDVGCGNMQYLYYPEPFLENYLVGLDYNEDALTLARTMLDRINNGFLVCCMGEFLPFRKYCFDVVLCIDTLSYLKSTYLTILENMFEISKKQIILNVHHEDASYEKRFKFFDEKEIIQILEDNDFEVKDLHIITAREHYGIDPSKRWPSHLEPPDTKMYIHIKVEKYDVHTCARDFH